MKYYYLVQTGLFDNYNGINSYVLCFNSKKSMLQYAEEQYKNNSLFRWYYVTNKKDLPANTMVIIGNGICKDYYKKNDVLVMKDSLKDRRK